MDRGTNICWLCKQQLTEEVLKKLGTPISELGLSSRPLNALTRYSHVKNVEDLLKIDIEEFWIRGIGKKGLEEIIEKIEALGYKIRSRRGRYTE